MTEQTSPFHDPELVRALVDDSSVLFGAMTGDGTVTWMNRGAEALLGLDPATVAGRHALELIHPDDHDVLMEVMAEEARGSDDRSVTTVRLAHADGRWVAFEFAGLDERQADGTGTYLVWGRPFEYMTRLMAFLDTLLTDSEMPHVLEHVIAWQDVTILHSASLILVRGDSGYEVVAHSRGMPEALAKDVPPDAAVPDSWHRMLGGEIGIDDITMEDLPADMRAAARAAGYQACWTVPVGPAGTPDPVAVVVTWRSRPGAATGTQQRRLLEGAQIVRLALEWGRAQEALRTAATTDPLTGVSNRAHLEQVMRSDRSEHAALLFCDLDDFKEVNDRHGHPVGDMILRVLAARMGHAVRSQDLVARLGGDEFGVWCPRIDDAAEAVAVAERLIEVSSQPVVIDGFDHQVSMSIGIVVLDHEPGGARDLDKVLEVADQALYRAKGDGKARFVVV